MVKFADFNPAETRTVFAIARRAVLAGIYDDMTGAEMDICAVSVDCPLRLDDLLAADDFNFAHDMAGILRHINRRTGRLENFFLPRFAKPQPACDEEATQ